MAGLRIVLKERRRDHEPGQGAMCERKVNKSLHKKEEKKKVGGNAKQNRIAGGGERGG